MLDPAYGVYLSDLQGNALSPWEIRENLSNFIEMNLISTFSETNYINYVNSLAWYIYSFESLQDNYYGAFENPGVSVYFPPVGFYPDEWHTQLQMEIFRIMSENVLNEQKLAEMMDLIRQRQVLYATSGSFWAVT